MTILTAHQPNYLPYPGFFEKILRSDIFLIVDNVQFVKRGTFGWQNRNRIKTVSGPIWLTVPVLTKGKYFQKINEVFINNNIPWQRKHLRAIEFNYNKSPFFMKHFDFFLEVYNNSWNKLCDLNEKIILYLINIIKKDIDIKRTSELNILGEKTDLIINMCEKLKCNTYISGVHGKDYLDMEKLNAHDIKIIFQAYKSIPYKQQYKGFLPNLSAIDLLFNEGKIISLV